ncbi:MAG: J domain-containing protein [Ramlibacter sp.]|nr:J domain-containing protein [Ramlibacter sp.]
MQPGRSFYDVLGVARQATPEDIRRAYRRRAQKFHPDKSGGRSDAAAIMAQINKAYEVLSDAGHRAAYDEQLNAVTPYGRSRPAIPLVIGGWPWYILSGTLCLILLVLGWVAVNTLAPRRVARTPITASPPVLLAEPVNRVAPPAIEPWRAPPARPTAAVDDPVARLVREGVVTPREPRQP